MLLDEAIVLLYDVISLRSELLRLKLLHLKLVLELRSVSQVIDFVDECHQVQDFVHVLLSVSSEWGNSSH